ncbi:MAG: sigma-54-dependent Fis family transcriptional regulator [Candidatus Hydrogenedentes bacterium]|nr:sigma-54-dependent Fis family transcriptional regulator [Candidatus Hydrogenedentota bacterium]
MHEWTRVNRLGRLMGGTPSMRRLYRLILKASTVDMPVLIVGETGSGKELVALEIHERSARKDKPFVAVNTGVLSAELVASELFGHVKGAFTGADSDKVGRFSEAYGGTLFLDEVATMRDSVQVALLRVLEDGLFRPVGGEIDQAADVRIIAATNVCQQQALIQSGFREDLLHRLQVVRIPVPSLSERVEDIPMLVRALLVDVNEKFDFNLDGISDAALETFKKYPWPGNVRELKNTIYQAALMAERGILQPQHIPARIVNFLLERTAETAPNDRVPDGKPETTAGLEFSKPNGPGSHPLAGPQETMSIPAGATLEEVQKAYMMNVLSRCLGNKTRAAKILGISRKTLHEHIKKWDH